MASPSRSRELTNRCEQLRAWAVREALTCWRQVDPDAIQATFTAVMPALVDIHRALCIEALTAVDLYMFCAAADTGFRYEPDWTRDQVGRPNVTYWGQDIATAVRKAPVITLWRIREGDPADTAMLRGWHALARIYNTEAHQIARTVVLDRVRADLRRRGL